MLGCILSVFRWDVSRSEVKYNLIPSTSSSWLFYYRTLKNLYESSTHGVYRKFNTYDILLCVNFRIHDIVGCPFSTILT